MTSSVTGQVNCIDQEPWRAKRSKTALQERNHRCSFALPLWDYLRQFYFSPARRSDPLMTF